MRKPLAITTLTITVMIGATTAQARPNSQWELRTIGTLRHQIQWHRTRTWYWEQRAGRTRTYTRHMERRTTSIPFLGWIKHLWTRRQAHARRLASHRYLAGAGGGTVQQIICRVFRSACSEAISVARCESGFSIHAVNGQYLGLFQMGTYERARFATIGYSTAYQQTVAAHNYYVISGWGPWACA